MDRLVKFRVKQNNRSYTSHMEQLHKKIMISTLFIVFSVLLLSCNRSATEKKSAQKIKIITNSIDKSVDTLLMDSLINSLSLGIYDKGEMSTKHYGELDKGKGNRPTDETIYEIASVTKTFVGTLIARAEMEGKLSIEDDIRKYIGITYNNLEYEGNPIKIRHLLTHTSELPRFLPESINDLFTEANDDELPFRIAEIENNYSKNKFLKDLESVEIDTVPGTRFSYSNADTELAAYILEKAYGKSFEKIMKEKILIPSNMPNTGINLNERQKKKLANGYGSNGKRTPYMSTTLWGASGAGKSTIVDLLNYIDLQLDKSDRAIRKTHQVLYDNEIIFGDPDNKIGYFWILNEDEDFGTYLSHHGGAYGMQNWMFIYPEKNIGISIITNQGDWQTGGKLMHIVNEILNEMKKAHGKG